MNVPNLFHETVDKLTDIYKNNPAQLESFASDVNKAFDTLLEFGDVGGINKAQASTAPRSFSGSTLSKSSSKAGAITGENKSESPATVQQIEQAGQAFLKVALSNPVAAQQYINRTVVPEIEKVAQNKFSNIADVSGTDWKSAFNDAVSGKTAEDVKSIGDKLTANSQKEGAKTAKEQEKKFWQKQKEMDAANKKKGFADRYNQMKAEDNAQAAEADKLMKQGYDPSIYGDLKKKPGRLKEKYLKWRSEAVDAMKCGDKARLEAAYAELRDIVSIVESMGYEVNAVLG